MLAQELESRHENYLTEDAEILLVGFGIVSRVLRTAVDQLRAQGMKAGLFRPITLWPFPSRELCETAQHVKQVLVVELSTGMMVEDVKLALNGSVPVEYYGRVGGNVPMAGRNHRAGVRAHGGPCLAFRLDVQDDTGAYCGNGYEVIHEKSPAFYDRYERKGELQQQTHYCPGLRTRHRRTS